MIIARSLGRRRRGVDNAPDIMIQLEPRPLIAVVHGEKFSFGDFCFRYLPFPSSRLAGSGMGGWGDGWTMRILSRRLIDNNNRHHVGDAGELF